MYTALGLMSGTSMDGIDAALVRTDGFDRVEGGAWLTLPYEPAFRQRLRSCLGGQGPVAEVERDLTDLHAAVVARLLDRAGVPAAAVDLLGFHGHTILHAPDARRTWQIGDGGRLAALTGIAVACDFRSADVAAGGQGAPLVPLFHAALSAGLPRPLAILNIGGVANVTWLGRGGGGEGGGEGEGEAVLAFDTGPGNALIDDWVLRHTGRAYDGGGALAASGRVDTAILDHLMSHPWFAAPPPKSLDRDAWNPACVDGLPAADGAATLAAFTAGAVERAAGHLPEAPLRWLVAGGGRHNAVLMAMLRRRLGVPVDPVEAVGWQGDALEAQAFGYLAVRTRLGLPLSLPGTTGVPRPMPGGRLFHPPGAHSATAASGEPRTLSR